MENRQQQILSEIKSLAASVRSQMETLESKVIELQQMLETEIVEVDIMDMELSPETEFYSEPEQEPAQETEPASEPEILSIDEETVVETDHVREPELVDDDLPFFDDLPPEPKELPVIDAMLSRHAWRTDMPGTSVKDIRSAISLNDRILFINYLFNEDPMSFQETLTKLNSMASFDEAATYMMSAFAGWDWESDTVYRFMMAVRRRLQ